MEEGSPDTFSLYHRSCQMVSIDSTLQTHPSGLVHTCHYHLLTCENTSRPVNYSEPRMTIDFPMIHAPMFELVTL